MSKVLKDIPLTEKNQVFETIIAIYDYTNDLITQVEQTSDSQKRNSYIAVLNGLISTIDSAVRTISTEYVNIIEKNKVTNTATNKIKKSLDKIFTAIDDAKKVLF